jgi:hypothetical protein
MLEVTRRELILKFGQVLYFKVMSKSFAEQSIEPPEKSYVKQATGGLESVSGLVWESMSLGSCLEHKEGSLDGKSNCRSDDECRVSATQPQRSQDDGVKEKSKKEKTGEQNGWPYAAPVLVV